ncbi:hypothetical protein [Rhodopseudomonas pseudopalustris]|uniref:Lipoprotein n=1 Tax=Rhodopseudomonas pseudopalustris TaxID=1513892 RepID=A0A1H8Q2Q0_9BRAD|nr:hypothetical protein [Rhodopseudomonas pseudopalustris]SEO48251.1 hypothetical protein SAMN05444123_10323 [Rhodopseudomonas pseudopalustris]
MTASIRRIAFALLAAASLSGCITSDDPGPSGDGGDAVQSFPTNYRSEIPLFLRSYLNNPVGLRDAAMAEPVQRPVGGKVRFVSCVRFTLPSDKPQDLAIVHVNGRLDRVVGNFQELCAGVVTAPFPELEKLSR